ncbi:MAG TPA: hypothetical protein GX704_03430 [Clostridiales bacterium]|jgi:hypothetical protein|nr:hypothetical protein [Clostridiales bacterium]
MEYNERKIVFDFCAGMQNSMPCNFTGTGSLLKEDRSMTETGEILRRGSVRSSGKSFKACFGVPPTRFSAVKTGFF